jgi:hypothetical protein
MTPYQIARATHRRDPDNDPWEEVLHAHLLTGYVISTPEVFLMFRPVDSRANPLEFDRPWISYSTPDQWHVYMASGDISQMVPFFPPVFDTISMVRKNRLRVYNRADMASKIQFYHDHGRTTESDQGADSGHSSEH